VRKVLFSKRELFTQIRMRCPCNLE